MRKDDEKDSLAEAVARLREEGLSQKVPESVVDETIRRLAAAGCASGAAAKSRRLALRQTTIRLALAAAAAIALGFTLGRLSGPEHLNTDQLRNAVAPSVAASIEPALRAKLIEDMQQQYQVALAATYVKIRDEVTAQYRDDLNRMAVQMLAASNAATNQLLSELVESIDTAQTQDLRRITRALYQIELNRIQDRTQLATGLQTLASRTEDGMRQLVQFVAEVRPEDFDAQGDLPLRIPKERNEP